MANKTKQKFLDTIRSKSSVELEKMAHEKRESLRNLRFDLASGKVKNAKAISQVRKEIAKILTVINQADNSVVTK